MASVPAGITIDHFQLGSCYNSSLWTSVGSIGAVDVTGWSWYQDTAADIVYFQLGHAGVASAVGMSYFVPADKWDGGSCTGVGDIDKANRSDPGDWPDTGLLGWASIPLDLTAWVQAWLDNPTTNFGVMLCSEGSEIRWYSSEYAGDTSLRPKLLITYEAGGAVPEPAGLSLIGLALITLRRGKRS